MNRGSKSHGYTIVEVMIVLAVTGALLVSVMLGISGQQRRTEFTQSINDFQAQVNDVINNVATGYATNTGDFTCIASGSGPQLGTGTNNQGTSSGCIVLGRAMQLAVSGTNSAGYNTYTVVGLRQKNGQEVTILDDALPKIVAQINGGKDSFDVSKIQGGIKVTKMYYTTDGSLATAQPIGAVAFLSSLGQYTGCTNLCSGATNVGLYPVKTTLLEQNADSVTLATSGLKAANLSTIPNGSVVMCLQSGGTDQYGVVTIGSNKRQLTTKLDILDTATATAVITGPCGASAP